MLKKPKPLLCLLLIMTAACLTGCGDGSVSTLASSASFHGGSAGGYDTDGESPATVVIAGEPIEYVFDAGIVFLDFALPAASHVTITFSPLDIAWQSGETATIAGTGVVTDIGPTVLFENDMEAGLYDLAFNADFLPSGCYRIVLEAKSSLGTYVDIRNALLIHGPWEVPSLLWGVYQNTICRYYGDCW